jgi:hypothetical protein
MKHLLRIGLRLVLSYLLYGALAYAFERVIVGVPAKKFNGRPFIHVYAVGACLLVAVDELSKVILPQQTAVVALGKVLASTALLSVLECVFGKVGKYIRERYGVGGGGTWQYDASGYRGVCCGGFSSLESVGCWALLSTVFFLADPLQYVII